MKLWWDEAPTSRMCIMASVGGSLCGVHTVDRGAAVSWAVARQSSALCVPSQVPSSSSRSPPRRNWIHRQGSNCVRFKKNISSHLVWKYYYEISRYEILPRTAAAGCRAMFTNIHLSHFNLSKQWLITILERTWFIRSSCRCDNTAHIPGHPRDRVVTVVTS